VADLMDLFPAPPDIGKPISARDGNSHNGPANLSTPCRRPASKLGGHTCWVGGGDAYYSWDGGKTWACRLHVPGGFFALRDAAKLD
jgi:hypothetical protein